MYQWQLRLLSSIVFKVLISIFLTSLAFYFTVSEAMSATVELNRDPWRPYNKVVYHFNKTLDGIIVRPIAKVYLSLLSVPVRQSVSNFFDNLENANVVVNDVLQGKFHQASSDSCRLVINTSIGVIGFFDPAASLGFPEHNEDLGQTLAVWGLDDGGYFIIPVLGAATVRSAFGKILDYALNPLLLLNDVTVSTELFALDTIDTRTAYFAADSMVTGNEYEFVRNAFLQRREYLINDGKFIYHVEEDLDWDW